METFCKLKLNFTRREPLNNLQLETDGERTVVEIKNKATFCIFDLYVSLT